MNEIDLCKIFPRVQRLSAIDKCFLPSLINSHKGKSEAQQPVYTVIAPELAMYYMYEKEEKEYIIHKKMLSDSISLTQIHEAALENMILKTEGKIKATKIDEQIIKIESEEIEEAALLIWDDLWYSVEEIVGVSFYMIIPQNNTLYITSQQTNNALEMLDKWVRSAFEDSKQANLLVPYIYQRKSGGWHKVIIHKKRI